MKKTIEQRGILTITGLVVAYKWDLEVKPGL